MQACDDAYDEVLKGPNRKLKADELTLLAAYFTLSDAGQGGSPNVIGDNINITTIYGGQKTYSLLNMEQSGNSLFGSLLTICEDDDMVKGFNQEHKYWKRELKNDQLHELAKVHRDIAPLILWMSKH
jgi:hypothetical protein